MRPCHLHGRPRPGPSRWADERKDDEKWQAFTCRGRPPRFPVPGDGSNCGRRRRRSGLALHQPAGAGCRHGRGRRPDRAGPRRHPGGGQIKILWRGKPYFVRNRTEAEIKAAQDVDVKTLRDRNRTLARVKEGQAKWLITAANCTHLGCVPLGNQGDYGRLVLPLPRFALRHVRPHPQGPCADQPADPAIHLRQ